MSASSGSSVLRTISDQLASVVTRVAPSLVFLRNTRRPASGTVWQIDDEGPLVVTTTHVLGGKDEGFVETAGGETRAARVIGRDTTTDISLLRIEGDLAGPLARATAELAVGHLVVAVGRLEGRTNAVLGMVSSLGGAWRSAGGGKIDRHIDVDAALPMGFSGGVLVEADGGLVGINTHALVRGGTTLPAETVDRVVEQLRTHGSVRRGWLGVGVQPVRLPERVAKAAGHEVGLLVTSLAEGGPAQSVMHVGDVIVSVDGTAVERFHDLLAVLSGAAGRTLELQLVRADQTVAVSVKAVDRPNRRREVDN
jgi:S1-C subfamily serine protease